MKDTVKKIYAAVNGYDVNMGIFLREEDVPWVLRNKITQYSVSQNAWDKGLVFVNNFREHLFKHQETFTREEVRDMLIQSYKFAVGYSEYGRNEDFYVDDAIKYADRVLNDK